jgi:hypothetical protein
VFTYRIPWVHLIINYCVDKLYLFTFDKSVYVNHFHPIKTYLVTLISNLIEIHFFQSFLRNTIFNINDIWDKNNKTSVENQTIVIALSITFWIFFSFSSFGTMILLFWFLIFKFLSIIKPYDLFIFSFSSDFNINDIWDKNNKTSVENQTIFNRLDDERNWISDCAKIKK